MVTIERRDGFYWLQPDVVPPGWDRLPNKGPWESVELARAAARKWEAAIARTDDEAAR